MTCKSKDETEPEYSSKSSLTRYLPQGFRYSAYNHFGLESTKFVITLEIATWFNTRCDCEVTLHFTGFLSLHWILPSQSSLAWLSRNTDLLIKKSKRVVFVR